MTKGTRKCSDWEFYLKDVYMQFKEEGGRDLSFSRCLLKFGTSNFISLSDPHSSANIKREEAKKLRKTRGRPFKERYQSSAKI